MLKQRISAALMLLMLSYLLHLAVENLLYMQTRPHQYRVLLDCIHLLHTSICM